MSLSDPLEVVQVLRKARRLIEPEDRWTQGAYARDGSGGSVWLGDPESYCWCSAGAIDLVAGAPVGGHRNPRFARHALNVATGTADSVVYRSAAFWNDAPDRKHGEVLAAFRLAEELAARGQV